MRRAPEGGGSFVGVGFWFRGRRNLLLMFEGDWPWIRGLLRRIVVGLVQRLGDRSGRRLLALC